MGAAYDVFGNGKTAMKVNYSKYLQPANNESNFIQANPGVTLQTSTTSHVDAIQRQLRPRLRSRIVGGQRRVRSLAEPELRQPVQHHAGQPGHDARVGQPAVRLAVGRGAAAGNPAAPLGGRRVQPPVVEQLLRHRQPGARRRPTSTGSRSPAPTSVGHRCPRLGSRSRS